MQIKRQLYLIYFSALSMGSLGNIKVTSIFISMSMTIFLSYFFVVDISLVMERTIRATGKSTQATIRTPLLTIRSFIIHLECRLHCYYYLFYIQKIYLIFGHCSCSMKCSIKEYFFCSSKAQSDLLCTIAW